jgi:uncharacterized membrane protein
MDYSLARIQRFHSYLAAHGLYALLLSTLLAIGLFIGRIYLSEMFTFRFLVWNLFLAWVPYFVSMWAAYRYQKYPRRRWLLIIPGAVWLVFFPNAPYIVTDFLHLSPRPPVPYWYDVALLTTFAWTGVFLAVYSLRSMQIMVQTSLGAIAGWLFVSGAIGLGGFGIYVGRYLRWNSWDLLMHPHAVLSDIAIRFINPFSYPRTYGVTLVFAAVLFVCYLTITGIPSTEKK